MQALSSYPFDACFIQAAAHQAANNSEFTVLAYSKLVGSHCVIHLLLETSGNLFNLHYLLVYLGLFQFYAWCHILS